MCWGGGVIRGRGGSRGCSPLCSGPLHSCLLLSPPTVNHWESIISLSVLRQNGQGGVLLFLPLFFLSLILGTFGIWPISKVTQWLQLQSRSAKTQRVQPAQAHSHSFSLFVSVAFPATPGCMGRGGERRGVVSHPVWRKAGSSEPRAKCRRYSNQLSGCGPTVSMSC